MLANCPFFRNDPILNFSYSALYLIKFFFCVNPPNITEQKKYQSEVNKTQDLTMFSGALKLEG